MTAPTSDPTRGPELALHDRFPGAWPDWPAEARAHVAELLLTRALATYDGPAGLLKMLYAGTVRRGKRVSYTIRGTDCWAFLLEDLRAQRASNAPHAQAPESLASAETGP